MIGDCRRMVRRLVVPLVVLTASCVVRAEALAPPAFNTPSDAGTAQPFGLTGALPKVVSFNAAIAHVKESIPMPPPFPSIPVELFVPVISARVADPDGVETIDSVKVEYPNGDVRALGPSPDGTYNVVMLPISGFAGGTFRFWVIDRDGLTSDVAEDSVPPVAFAIPQTVSPQNGATDVSLTPTLNWEDLQGAAAYVVNVSPVSPLVASLPDPAAIEAFLDRATSVVSYLDAATIISELRIPAGRLKPNTTYYWVVGAVDKLVDLDQVSLSSVRSFTTGAGVTVAETTAPTFLKKPEIIGVTENSFTVAWQTDEFANSRAYYGATAGVLTDSVVTKELTTNHVVLVDGLESGAEYVVEVASSDYFGNELRAVYPRRVYTLETADDKLPVFVAGPVTQRVADDRVTIYWANNEPTVGTVHVVGGAKDTTVTDPVLIREHVVEVIGLSGATRHTFTVSVWDAAGNGPVVALGEPFLTRAAPDRTPPRVLKGPIVIPQETEAFVLWGADELHTARVELRQFGPQGAFIGDVFVDQPGIGQLARILGLQRKTAYQVVVELTDLAQNRTKTVPIPFRTLAERDTIPPRILRAPAVVYRSDSRIVVEWVTDEPADSYAEIRQQSQLVTTFSDGAFVREHRLLLTDLSPDGSYEFIVKSADASGNEVSWPEAAGAATKLGRAADRTSSSFTTAATPDLTPPTILGDPNVIARTASSLSIRWETDELSNSVARFGATGGAKPARMSDVTYTETIAQTDNVTSHTVTITNLQPGTTYAYEVGSTDPSGNGETTSNVATTSTLDEEDFAPPVFIEQPAVIGKTNTRITVRWTTDEPSDSRVCYKLSGASPDDELVMALADKVTEHVVTITNLQAASPYELTVESTDLIGNGPATAALVTTTETEADLSPPVITSGPSVTTDSAQVRILWTTDEPSDSYAEYGETPALGQVVTRSDFTTRHEAVVTNLQPNTLYHFSVASSDAVGNIADSSGAALVWTTLTSPDVTPPAKVQGLTAAVGAYAVRLSWTPNADPDLAGYVVERSRSGGPFTTIASLTATTYTDQAATLGTPYEYRVRAKDVSANGNLSEPSDPAAVTPSATDAPGAPTAFPHDTTVSGRPVLTVANAQPNSRAIGSYLFVLAADSVLAHVVTTAANVPPGASTTAWQVPFMLDHLATYWWGVRAVDAAGFQGPFSQRTSFTVDTVAKKVAVKLASFAATAARRFVEISWEVAPGSSNARFHVWRATGEDEEFTRLTSEPLGEAGPEYRYVDRIVVPGVLYRYRLEASQPEGQSTMFGPVSVRAAFPEQVTLNQNVPNPFNPITQISYELPMDAQVRATIYNALGQRVRDLVNEVQSPGYYRIGWDGTNAYGGSVASGIYFARLVVEPTTGRSGTRAETRVIRMLLIR